MEKKREKENLNIIIADGSTSKEYIDYLSIYFNITVLESKNVKKSTEVDLILFTGGADVDPQQYGEKIGKYTSINKQRDEVEMDTYYRFLGKPKLGICRGAQLLTVLSKGKLVQHVEGHTREHKITIENYGSYIIPSTHHQMMYPYTLYPEDYALKAWSTNFLSTTYLNGDNEEVKLPNDFLEPEIVEYLKTKCLCIQGHPELGNDEIKDMTLYMISNFLNKFNKKTNNIKVDNIEDSEYSGYSLGRSLINEESSLKTGTIFKGGSKKDPWIESSQFPVWMTSGSNRNTTIQSTPRVYGTKGAIVDFTDPIDVYEKQSEADNLVSTMKQGDFYHTFDTPKYLNIVKETHNRLTGEIRDVEETTIEKF